MNRIFQAVLLLCSVLALTACGFHLRRSVPLPDAMKHVHLTVGGGAGSADFQRYLARALTESGVIIEKDSGTNVAELKVPVARFSTDMLTTNGYAQVTEYSVHYQVQFDLHDGSGELMLPTQTILMERDFSYDAVNTVGTTAQVEEIQRSLNDDMVQAILFRLRALSSHIQQNGLAVPAQASTASAPASATSVAAPATQP